MHAQVPQNALDGMIAQIAVAAVELQAAIDHVEAGIGRQALGFRIADYATAIEAARLMLHRAAAALDLGDPNATRLAAMAKRLATDTGFDVVNGCLQLHGGYGYLRDHPIERVLRDLRVHQILEGTNEVMRVIVSRDMLGN